MHPRLAKEVRPLLVPFALMTAGMLISPVLGFTTADRPLFQLFFGLLGTALLSVCAFASEHQERTFVLLLSQPVSQARIWWEKYRVILPLALVPILLIINFWPAGIHRLDGAQFTVLACSLVGALATGPLWAGLTQSTIGGFAFSVTSQLFALVVCLYLFDIAKVFHRIEDSVLAVGVVYSTILAFLGWRNFGRKAGTQTNATRAETESRSALRGALGVFTPRCRPCGRWLNLLRRELCLQRATLQLALVSLGMTLALLALDLSDLSFGLRPLIDAMLLFPVYVASGGVALLAGSIALSEEKSLGTAAWSQVLPVSTRAQYFIKVAVATVMVLLLGLAGPLLVAKGYRVLVPHAFLSYDTIRFSWFYLVGLLLPFALSLHLAVLARDTLQAVLLTIAITAGAAFALVLAFSSLQLLNSQALTRGTLLWTVATTGTPFGSLPMVLSVLAVLAALGRFLWSASGNFGRTLSRRSSILIAAWCILLPACTGLVVGLFGASYSAALNTQVDTFEGVLNRLQPIIKRLDRIDPLRTPGQTVTYNLDQFRAAFGNDAAKDGLFTDAKQQFVLQFIRVQETSAAMLRQAGVRRVDRPIQQRLVRVTFQPPLVVEGNPDPRLGFIHYREYLVDP
jgi:hypothetical protein